MTNIQYVTKPLIPDKRYITSDAIYRSCSVFFAFQSELLGKSFTFVLNLHPFAVESSDHMIKKIL